MSKIAKLALGFVGVCAIGGIGQACRQNNAAEERCNNIEARVEAYMENRPHAEFTDLQKRAMQYGDYGIYMQSSVDSLAYREIFTSSLAAADSAAVNEFNKLASSMRRDAISPYLGLSSHLYNKLGKMLTHKQFKQIENEAKKDVLTLQFKADSVAYRRFFEKHGLLNDSTLKKFSAIAKKIRP